MTLAPENARTALAEFGIYLGANDTEVSVKEARTLLKVAFDFMDAQPHGLDCPRCYDDHDCTCSIGHIADALYAAQEDLEPKKCKNCDGSGVVNPKRTHGHGYDMQQDRDCPLCDSGIVEPDFDERLHDASKERSL